MGLRVLHREKGSKSILNCKQLERVSSFLFCFVSKSEQDLDHSRTSSFTMVIPKGTVTLCLSCLSSSILWDEKLYNIGTFTLSYQYELKETQSQVASLSNTKLYSQEHRKSQQMVFNLVTLKAYFKLRLPFCKLFIVLVSFN